LPAASFYKQDRVVRTSNYLYTSEGKRRVGSLGASPSQFELEFKFTVETMEEDWSVFFAGKDVCLSFTV
jgi:hypothetical protein